MTIQYLVTGREGYHNSHLGAEGSAITKTYGDIFKYLKEDELVKAIISQFHKDCIYKYSDGVGGEELWDENDFEDAYSEENNWNCVDLIFKFESPTEIPEPIYSCTWEHD